MTEPEIRQQVIHDLRAALLLEAADLLDTARRNDAAGRLGNAAYCRRAAKGLCEARIIVARPGFGTTTGAA